MTDLTTAVNNGGYGTVVKVDGPIMMSGQNTIYIPAGVTIRSDRRGANFGQVIFGAFQPEEIFHVVGDDVRITQLHLEGPSSSTDSNPNSHAIIVESSKDGSGNFLREYLRTNIDHNDIFAFTYSAITVDGSQDVCSCTDASKDCNGNPLSGLDYSGISNDPLQRPTNVHIARNYIHDNSMNEAGYGIDNYHGGYTLIEGNTFRGNRHSITGDGRAKSGYIAASNLILTYTPQRDTHDFDMHGSSESKDNIYDSVGYGGIGGDYINMFQNTFMSDTRADFELRGQICNYADFHNNISLNDEATDSVLYDDGTTLDTGDLPSFVHDSAHPYQFGKPDPTTRLFVGDFDGDGFDDLFMATGAAWYYSPAGKWDWRFLSAKTETNDQLLFGDFDGDGRTDVVTIDSLGRLMVSWGGVSDWELLNPYVSFSGSPADIVASMAVGDFTGDQRSDIFFADGTNWWLSDGGSTGFVQSQTSGYFVKDLRFGDFDGDGKTDVFGIVGGQWVYSKSAMGSWSSGVLQTALTSSVNGLVVADFNGDGLADVALACGGIGCGWKISYGGTQDWAQIFQGLSLSGPFAGAGYFRGKKGAMAADILYWNAAPGLELGIAACDSNADVAQFCIAEYGINPGILYGAQPMR